MAEDVWDLSDEELEAAFKEAKAQDESPETAIEDEVEVEEEEIEIEEEEVEELEQPEEDSDDDTSTEDEIEEVEDEDPEEEEGEPDEELDADEDKSETEDDEAKEEEVQPTQNQLEEFFAQKSNVRANGMDHEFTNKEKLEMFDKMFPQATDYTKKMQAIKPYRKTIDAIEQAGLGQEDVNLMIDVLKGDKDAIADVLKRTGVDALDLDTENTNYVAKDYGRNDTELAIKDIVDEISVDREYAVTHNVLEKQWDDRSRDAFIEDPSMIKLLHIDVKSGMYDTINPIAQKLKVYDGGAKSDLDYYKAASQQYFESQAQNGSKARDAEAAEKAREAKEAEARKVEEVKARRAKQSATKKASAKRKAAAPTKKSAGTKQVNYLDDSDEAFEDWYNKLQESY